ncbi:MAG: YggS family pyridoxal phosphate-dependent enzyme [Proteobacteria bacterium]|nr:YggS family pyridoxal phosphate-dependent enzyme [Desulfobacteraceae bacterium]MBU3981189.1 YggS family pyridoxal phosphate-dependent enzyme [Pseudomonadota bacterium]MBU4013809.1 YggS family pyridoxal phosphate-dependent enzyme [Pseudomonadota bacterium]MBU4067796.1 YggS family pyridoxal phosphate-dependent enzyme [Pseudomonadota bacterium]MBU4100483.1 YggS family pyridoxal phosphate-dependent enzyme [Pseudomonadota bacterium]
MEFEALKIRLINVKERIKKAAVDCGRDPESVRLVVASKTIPEDTVREAIKAGVKILGESYIQEARDKINILSSYPVSWHFIGHLQSNKAKYAVKLFDMIHTVDSLKLAKELNKQAKKINKIQKILIQVNISMESTKSGIYEEDAQKLIKEISLFEHVSVKGLMTMPPFFNNSEIVGPYFLALRNLQDKIRNEAIKNINMQELSMGMTGDFEVAIKEGATFVRIGTAIFGERS